MQAQTALFFCLVANAAGQSFLLVILPPLGRQLGFSDIQTGSILSVSALLLMVSAAAWGYLSERIGRRPVLVIALAGAALALAAFSAITGARMDGGIAPATALVLFFAIRCGQVIVSGGLMPAAQAYMADVTAPERRASGMGLLGAAYGLGVIVGAAVAWRIGGGNAVLAFALHAILAGLGFLSVLLFVSEPDRRERQDERQETSAAIRLPIAEIWPFLAITVVAVSTSSILQQVTALRLQDALHVPPDESIAKAGAALMATALMMVAVQGGVLRFLTWAPQRLLCTGALLAAFAMLLGSFARSYAEIFGALVLFGAALGLMLPGNLASLSLRAGGDAQGKAAGVNAIGQGLGMAIGPVAGASLHQVAPEAPFAASAILLVLAFCLAVAGSRSRGHATTAQAA
jgi:DHA1 family tetracycline resistance protein-like MFS transporter